MPGIQNVARVEWPREKMEKYGPEKLSDAELLAIILRTGAKGLNAVELSKKILKKFSREKITTALTKELQEAFGLGPAKACGIVACFELGKRLLNGKQAALILSPKDVWENLRDIRDHRKEHFIIFYLDTRNQEIQREVISVGTLNANLVHPREVFEPAVRNIAAQILIAHNHPSGNHEPSEEDIEITRRLTEAGILLGIEVMDHVIVTKTSYLSLRERGIM